MVGSWHKVLSDALLAGAIRALDGAGNTEREIISVPGAFELPLGTKQAFARGFDCAVALGVVIRGDTPHFDYVCRGATDGLMRVMLDASKPIGFGLLTVDDEEQALARVGLPGSMEDKGAEAALAALAMVRR